MLGMSKKYAVLVNVEGKTRILSLTSNASLRETKRLCREMAEMLFVGQRLGDLRIEPWPLDTAVGRDPLHKVFA